MGLRGWLLAGCIVASLIGCAPSGSAVYVDLSQVPLAPSPVAPPAPVAPTAPSAPGAGAYAIPGVPASVESRSTAAGAARVDQAIAQSRERSYETIVRRLHAAYIREALALRDRKLAEFEPSRRAVLAAAMAKISSEYVSYANEVGPKYAQLAVLAGFPDPDPNSKRKPSTTDGMSAQATINAKKIRSEISNRAAQFQKFTQDALRAAEVETNDKLTQLLADIAAQTADADARAATAAKADVAQARAQIGDLLADQPPIVMPAVPGAHVVLAPSPGRAGRVRLPESARQPLGADSTAMVRSDLDVWLAVNRYRLGRKGAARDATREFVAWRSQFARAASTSP